MSTVLSCDCCGKEFEHVTLKTSRKLESSKRPRQTLHAEFSGSLSVKQADGSESDVCLRCRRKIILSLFDETESLESDRLKFRKSQLHEFVPVDVKPKRI